MIPPLKFVENSDKSIRHLEWAGILKLVFNGDRKAMYKAYPAFQTPSVTWQNHFTLETNSATDAFKDKPKRDTKALYLRIQGGEIQTLDELYTAIDFVSGPTLNKAQVNAAKKVVGQRGYQKEKLGEDFIYNDTLISQAKALANVELAATQPSDADLYAIIKPLDGVAELTDGQRINLVALIRKRLIKFTAIDTVEAAIARTKDRAAALLWLQIKAHHRLGDIPFKLGQTRVIELIGGSATKVNAACTVLVECGAIKKLSSGVKGKAGNPAAQYKRLV